MKKIVYLILLLLLISSVSGVYRVPPSSYDYKNFYNLININFTSSNLTHTNMPWANLTNYPVACPAYSAITQLNDSVTCTDYWVHRDGDTMTGQLNIENDLNVSSSIWVGNISPFLNENKVMAEGGFTSHNGFSGKNSDWRPLFKMWDSDHAETFHTINTGTGGYTYSNNLFCDYTANPFASDDAVRPKHWITILNGTHSGAMARIDTFVNSSCAGLSDNPGWNADLSGLKWKIKEAPKVMFNDEGNFRFWLGNTTESKVRITTPHSANSHNVWIDAIAGAEQLSAFTIDTDIKNYTGIIGETIFMKSSTGVDGATTSGLKIVADRTGVNNSHLKFIDIDLLNHGSDNKIDVLSIHGQVDHIIRQGSVETIKSAWYDNVLTTQNVTATFTNKTDYKTVFENTNSYIYIGSNLNFTRVGFLLDVFPMRNLEFEYYYCNSSSGWETLSSVTDTSNGGTISGAWTFINPDNRGTCNTEVDGTAFNDTTNYTYVAIKRTRTNIHTYPVIQLVTIGGASHYAILQEDLMRLRSVSTAPQSCDATILGAIYFNSIKDDMCICRSTGWRTMLADGVC